MMIDKPLRIIEETKQVKLFPDAVQETKSVDLPYKIFLIVSYCPSRKLLKPKTSLMSFSKFYLSQVYGMVYYNFQHSQIYPSSSRLTTTESALDKDMVQELQRFPSLNYNSVFNLFLAKALLILPFFVSILKFLFRAPTKRSLYFRFKSVLTQFAYFLIFFCFPDVLALFSGFFSSTELADNYIFYAQFDFYFIQDSPFFYYLFQADLTSAFDAYFFFFSCYAIACFDRSCLIFQSYSFYFLCSLYCQIEGFGLFYYQVFGQAIFKVLFGVKISSLFGVEFDLVFLLLLIYANKSFRPQSTSYFIDIFNALSDSKFLTGQTNSQFLPWFLILMSYFSWLKDQSWGLLS